MPNDALLANTPPARLLREGFRPAYLESGWFHERHHGWRVVKHAPRFKALSKRYGPLVRYLVASSGLSPYELDEEVGALPMALACAVNVCDTSDFGTAPERSIAGLRYAIAGEQARVFPAYTFVWDLGPREAELRAGMNATMRNYAGKAGRRGLGFSWRDGDDAARTLDAFLPVYAEQAVRIGAPPPDADLLHAMIRRRDLSAVVCTGKGGAPAIVNLLYHATPTCWFLEGARTRDVDFCAGAHIQWCTALELKRRGHRFYELGGIPLLYPEGQIAVPDEAHGLVQFKRALGAELVCHGREYVWRAPSYGVARGAVTKARASLARLTRREAAA